MSRMIKELWEKTIECFEGREDLENSCFWGVYFKLLNHAKKIASGKGCCPEEVAKVVCRAASAERPKARYCVPGWSGGLTAVINVLPTRVADYILDRI